MPRNLKKNRFIYMSDRALTLSTAAGDIALTTLAISPPSMPQGVRVTDWGWIPSTAQVGATVFPITLQKSGTTTDVTGTIDIASTAVGAEATGVGNDTTIAAGDILNINVNTITGTSTTAPIGCIWVGFSL